jgi:hypothetical protein
MSDWWSADPIASGDAPAPSGGRTRVVINREPSPYADAIAKVESGGRYDILGPRTRTGDQAYGKYQVMGANVGPWTEEILGQRLTPQQFLASPEAQDAVFNGKFGGYAKKYGPEGAAKAWFAGEGGMNDPNRRDILGTSVADYARKFNGAMGAQPSQAMGFAPEQPPQAFQPLQNAGASQPAGGWWSADPMAPPQQAAPQAAPESAPGRQVGMMEAGGRGVAQGMTFNFLDEIKGLVEASGAKPEEAPSLYKLLEGAYKYWSGDPEARKTYEATVARERAAGKEAETQQPGASLVGNVAGAIALPIGGMLQAASLPGRIGRGAAVGAGTGALYGAGGGEDAASRLTGAASGGAVGAGLGAAAPVAIRGIQAAGQGIAAAARPLTTAIRGARDPEAEAARRIVVARNRDIKAGEAGLGDAEFAAARASGVPVANVDQGGSVTRSLARSAANTSPEARGALERATSDRFEGQAPRAVEFLTNLVSTQANAGKTREALEKAAQTARKPFYDRAYRDGAGGIWDDQLSELSQAPAVQEAIKAATTQAQNRASSGRAGAYLSVDGKPTLEFWDLVKRQLDQKINVAKRAGAKEDVMEFNDLRSVIVQKLDTAVPSYSTARGVAAELFKASNALEAGEMFVTSGKLHDVRRAISKMSPEERDLFSEGFVSSFIDKVQKVGDRRSILNQIGQSSDARQRFEIALGPQRSKELEAFLRVENIMDRMRGALGNSSTARQLIEAGLAGGAAGAIYSGGDPSSAASGAGMLIALRQGGKLLNQRIDEKVSRKVGEMLASSDPKVLQKGIALVTRSPTLMKLLRAADDAAARVGGEQSSGVPLIQSMGPSRAEEQ